MLLEEPGTASRSPGERETGGAWRPSTFLASSCCRGYLGLHRGGCLRFTGRLSPWGLAKPQAVAGAGGKVCEGLDLVERTSEMSRRGLTTESTEEFFASGKEIARLADQGRSIPESCIRSFEDTEDLARLLTSLRQGGAMSNLEQSFPELYAGLSAEQRAELTQTAEEAVLRHAAAISPEEYLRVARELGCRIFDVVVQSPGGKELRFSHQD